MLNLCKGLYSVPHRSVPGPPHELWSCPVAGKGPIAARDSAADGQDLPESAAVIAYFQSRHNRLLQPPNPVQPMPLQPRAFLALIGLLRLCRCRFVLRRPQLKSRSDLTLAVTRGSV